jgi:hypothetical protein
MIRESLVAAVLFVFAMSSTSWAFGGGGGGGFGVPSDLLMPPPPTNVSATASNGMATVNFTPPKLNGRNPIIHYTVVSYPGKIKVTGTESPIVVKGLINGKSYTFRVSATNSVGTGLYSEPSNCVTPSGE